MPMYRTHRRLKRSPQQEASEAPVQAEAEVEAEVQARAAAVVLAQAVALVPAAQVLAQAAEAMVLGHLSLFCCRCSVACQERSTCTH